MSTLNDTTDAVEAKEPARPARGEHLQDPLSAVQLKSSGSGGGGDVPELPGGDRPLPYFGSIQASFGKHDVSGVKASVGGRAASAASEMGARAWASGDTVGFKSAPDLHTAAHEAAHTVQQGSGVQLKGGIGQAGDRYERHADAVADKVVAGESAESLLDTMTGGSPAGLQRVVQLDDDGKTEHTGRIRKARGLDDAQEIVVPSKEPQTLTALARTTSDSLGKYPDMPGGPQAETLLRKCFGSNWFFAKDVLVQGKWPAAVDTALGDQGLGDDTLYGSESARHKLMRKFLALRNWDYDKFLKQVRKKYEAEDGVLKGEAVLKWGNEGAQSLTSDIDVNLKGKYNMQAVGEFNTLFRQKWPHEAGVVYDVNVYCIDNMHGFDFNDDTKLMTIKNEPNAPQGLDTMVEDVEQQEVAALVKLIRFMCHGHAVTDGDHNARWERYKTSIGAAADSPALEEEGPRAKQVALRNNIVKAEANYTTWHDALADEKAKLLEEETAVQQTLTGLASSGDEGADRDKKHADALDMQASNRLYEKKIQQLIKARKKLETLSKKSGDHSAAIKATTIRLRQLVLEAGMFANEAMVTRGASNFVVFGTQVGVKKDPNAKIRLTEAQFYHAFTEQLADTVKEFGHFQTMKEGIYKGGKYLMRMTLAFDQLGVEPGGIANLADLRKLGDWAMAAKGDDDMNVTQKQDALGSLLDGVLGGAYGAEDAPAAFIDNVVIPFGGAVSKAYKMKEEDTGSTLKDGRVRGEGQDEAHAEVRAEAGLQ